MEINLASCNFRKQVSLPQLAASQGVTAKQRNLPRSSGARRGRAPGKASSVPLKGAPVAAIFPPPRHHRLLQATRLALGLLPVPPPSFGSTLPGGELAPAHAPDHSGTP